MVKELTKTQILLWRVALAEYCLAVTSRNLLSKWVKTCGLQKGCGAQQKAGKMASTSVLDLALFCDGCSCEEFSLNSEERARGKTGGVLGRRCCRGGGQRKANVAEGWGLEGKSETIQSPPNTVCATTAAVVAPYSCPAAPQQHAGRGRVSVGFPKDARAPSRVLRPAACARPRLPLLAKHTTPRFSSFCNSSNHLEPMPSWEQLS